MKKFIAILSVLMMMMMAVLPMAGASAEETKTFTVTFRNGIKFGATADEVKATETQPLHEQTFGEKQNPHVTILSTDDFDINEGHTGTVQYLFWDGKLYTVMNTFRDTSIFNDFLASYKSIYGEPTVTSAEGSANWAESVSGNHPEVNGDQYVWDLGNKISLTLVQFGSNFATIYMDAN